MTRLDKSRLIMLAIGVDFGVAFVLPARTILILYTIVKSAILGWFPSLVIIYGEGCGGLAVIFPGHLAITPLTQTLSLN